MKGLVGRRGAVEVETFYLYRKEQVLGERPVCSSRRWKNSNNEDRSDPLRSVQVKSLRLTWSASYGNRTLAS